MKNIFTWVLIFLLSLFCSGCSFPSFSSSERPPEEIVEEFYERYFQCLNNEDVKTLDSCLEVHIKRPYLTKENRERIRQVINNLAEPDYDPLLCANNIPNQGYKVGGAVLDGNHAQVTAIFLYSGKEHKVPVRLKKEGSVWKIEEIGCN